MGQHIQSRKVARKVKKQIIKSLNTDTDWAAEKNVGFGLQFKRKGVMLTIVPARVRLLDQLIVSLDGSDVWFPPLTRCCLRSAVRLHALRRLNAHLS